MATTKQNRKNWWKHPHHRKTDLHPAHANKTHFEHWMKKHEKTFHPQEVDGRYVTWLGSVKRVYELNQRENASWTAGLNHLSAHSKEEFRQMMGLKIDELPKPQPTNITKRVSCDCHCEIRS